MSENSSKHIFMTKEEYKKRADGFELFYGYAQSRFGKTILGVIDDAICFLGFAEDEDLLFCELKSSWGRCKIKRDDALAQRLADEIFIDKKEMRLLLKATPFELEVLKTLMDIKATTLKSYKEVAISVGREKAIRAVANAIASNDISYLVPCHRVVSSSGALSGYRWGVELKKRLIASEL